MSETCKEMHTDMQKTECLPWLIADGGISSKRIKLNPKYGEQEKIYKQKVEYTGKYMYMDIEQSHQIYAAGNWCRSKSHRSQGPSLRCLVHTRSDQSTQLVHTSTPNNVTSQQLSQLTVIS